MCGSAVCNIRYIYQLLVVVGGVPAAPLLTKSILTNDRKERYTSLECQQSGGNGGLSICPNQPPEDSMTTESYEKHRKRYLC